MNKVGVAEAKVVVWARFLGLSILGAFFISLCSMIKIPFYPVPFTMHTFGIFLLAFTMKPRLALVSVVMYLVFGTIGLPVFAAKANTLWMVGKCAGYLFAFPVAVFVIAKMMEKKYSVVLAAGIGQLVIFSIGFGWLATFIGMKLAFTYGVQPFFFSDIVKIFLAYFVAKGFSWLFR